MPTDQNKALLRRLFEEGINQNRLSVFGELMAPDFLVHGPLPVTSNGPAGMREGVEMLKVNFKAYTTNGEAVQDTFHRYLARRE